MLKRMVRAVGFTVLVVSGAACGDSGGPGSRVPDVDALPDLEATEVLRLGSVDDPELGFTRIADVAVDRNGDLYVLESNERRVRVYDSAGRRLRTIGGPGSGPGEFRSVPRSLGLLGDTLWVRTETLSSQMTLFTRSGSFLSQVQAPPTIVQEGRFQAMVVVGGLRRDGQFGSSFSFRGMPDPPPDTFQVPRLIFDQHGEVVDTAGYQPFAFPPIGSRVDVGGREIPVPALNDREIRLDAGDTMVIVTRSPATSEVDAEFSVTRVVPVVVRDGNGALATGEDTLAHVRLRYRPRPFDQASIDSLIAPRAALYAQLGHDPDVVAAAMRRALALPPFQVPITVALLGADGGLWLRREEGGAATSRWLRIAPDGAPLGHVVLPRGARILWGEGDRILVVELDELDIPWLVGYRVGD